MAVKIEKEYRKGRFVFRHLGGNHVAIYPYPNINDPKDFFVMSGVDVVNYIEIEYFHRLGKLRWVHLDTNYAKCTDALKIILELEQGRSIFHPKDADVLFSKSGIIKATGMKPLGERLEYEPRTWTLTLNSTSTDIVFPVLYIQKMGK